MHPATEATFAYDDMGSALRAVCREDRFYRWIDLAGDDEIASLLRFRWPQVLISWRQRRATEEEVLEILALYRRTQEVTNSEFPPMERWLDNVNSNWREVPASAPVTPTVFLQSHSTNPPWTEQSSYSAQHTPDPPEISRTDVVMQDARVIAPRPPPLSWTKHLSQYEQLVGSRSLALRGSARRSKDWKNGNATRRGHTEL